MFVDPNAIPPIATLPQSVQGYVTLGMVIASSVVGMIGMFKKGKRSRPSAAIPASVAQTRKGVVKR